MPEIIARIQAPACHAWQLQKMFAKVAQKSPQENLGAWSVKMEMRGR
jgi:hypothetical protein